MINTGKNPDEIIKTHDLKQISDEGEIAFIIDNVLISNSSKVEQFKSGKVVLYDFFFGQVMKATKGMANPEIVDLLLKKKLKGS